MPPKPRSHHERFWAFVPDRPADGCWLWQGSRMPRGYGKFGVTAKESQYAHRLAYIFAKGPISDGLQIHHTCRVTACVNPEHLLAVTGVENMSYELGRQVYGTHNRGKTHCQHGHPFNEENTYYNQNHRRGWVTRTCRMCRRLQRREQRRRAAL